MFFAGEVHGTNIAAGPGDGLAVAEGKAGASFVGSTVFVRADTLDSEPVGVDEVRCAAAIGGEVFSSGADFAAVPPGGAQRGDGMASKFIRQLTLELPAVLRTPQIYDREASSAGFAGVPSRLARGTMRP